MAENVMKVLIPLVVGLGFIGGGAYCYWKEEFRFSWGDEPKDPPDYMFRGGAAKLASILCILLGVGVLVFFVPLILERF